MLWRGGIYSAGIVGTLSRGGNYYKPKTTEIDTGFNSKQKMFFSPINKKLFMFGSKPGMGSSGFSETAPILIRLKIGKKSLKTMALR